MSAKQTGLADTRYWLETYGRLRVPGPGHPSEWLGTPLAVVGLVAWLWSHPVPDSIAVAGGTLNWGTLFLMATMVYYFILSLSLAFGLIPFVTGTIVAVMWLDRTDLPLGTTGCALFLVAFCWQVLYSTPETASVSARLQYLMIGPAWLLAAVYRRARIPY